MIEVKYLEPGGEVTEETTRDYLRRTMPPTPPSTLRGDLEIVSGLKRVVGGRTIGVLTLAATEAYLAEVSRVEDGMRADPPSLGLRSAA